VVRVVGERLTMAIDVPAVLEHVRAAAGDGIPEGAITIVAETDGREIGQVTTWRKSKIFIS
jgi:hypothetical protein